MNDQDSGMEKIIIPANHGALFEAVGGRFANIIDYRQGCKSASAAIGRDLIDRYRPPSGHFLVHYVGVGDYEHFGFNKNTDAFSADTLEKRSHTFVTNGHYFEEHRNRDPEKRIGDIKYAAYNPKLGWTELLVWGDRTKAERQYEMIKAGKALASSMSCRIPEDRCNACQNRAKTRNDYCMCLTLTPGEYIREKRAFAFMWNDNPTFFDLSDVLNPAERVARQLGVWSPDDGIRKAASGKKLLGVDLADLMGVRLPAFQPFAAALVRTELEKLASLEARYEKELRAGFPQRDAFGVLAANIGRWAALGDMPQKWVEKTASFQLPSVGRMLAKRGILLPYGEFSRWMQSDVTKEACAMLPGLFRAMLQGGSPCGELFEDFKASPESTLRAEPEHGDSIDAMMDQAADRLGCGPALKPRVMQIIIIKSGGALPNVPLVTLPPEPLQHAYGLQKLASVLDIIEMRPDIDPEIIRLVAVAQNFIDQPE